jgi:hypothetical protein
VGTAGASLSDQNRPLLLLADISVYVRQDEKDADIDFTKFGFVLSTMEVGNKAASQVPLKTNLPRS